MTTKRTTQHAPRDGKAIPEGFVYYGEGSCSSSVEASDHAMQMDRIAQHASQQAIQKHQAMLERADETKKSDQDR